MTHSTFSQKFSYDLIIREGHLDTFGHVNNATYLQLFEEARWELITKNGYGLETIKNTKLGPIILDIKLKFLREIRLREKIRIETETLSYDRKIGVIRQQMINELEQVCCEAEMTIGLFSTEKRKLVGATPEWLRAIGVSVTTS